jgi:hypothetical protein
MRQGETAAGTAAAAANARQQSVALPENTTSMQSQKQAGQVTGNGA